MYNYIFLRKKKLIHYHLFFKLQLLKFIAFSKITFSKIFITVLAKPKQN